MSRIIALSQEPAASAGALVNVGVTTLGPTTDSGNAGSVLAQKVVVTAAGVLQSLSFYTNNAVGNLKLALYDASGAGGGPGVKLAETASAAAVVGWNTLNALSSPSVGAGTYWIAYEVSSSTLTYRSGNGGNLAFANQVYGTMPTPFPTFATGTDSWSFYMTLLTGGGPPPPPDTTPPSAPTNLTGTAI